MSKLVLAYAILSLLPIGFLVAMVRSIGVEGAVKVVLFFAICLLVFYALSWALITVAEEA